MYSIRVNKRVCVLSLLMMPFCTFMAHADDASHPVNSETASPVAVTPPVTTSMTSESAVVSSIIATPEPVAPEKAIVSEVKSVTPENFAEPVTTVPSEVAMNLDSEEQKRSYASGIAMAQYIEEQISRHKALHITLNKDILLAGMNDAFNHQEKMSVHDVHTTLAVFDEQVKILAQASVTKKQEGEKAFITEFAKRKDVKKTSKGLYYKIEEKGEGEIIKDTNQVEVSYRGELIDGTVVDGSPVENTNKIFHVANMPPVLRDSVKLIRKGGRIKVVIPPAVLESNNAAAKKNNEVMIYTITVVNVNAPQ